MLEAYFNAYWTEDEFDERGLEAKLEAVRHSPSQLEKL